MIEVEVEDTAWTDALPDAEVVAVASAQATINSAHPGEGRDPDHRAPALPNGAPAFAGVSGLGVAVLLSNDQAVAGLNARFRGKDGPTNVLSFPAPETVRPHLGDIALAYGVCAREAAEQGKPLDHHLAHLVAHGVLHLLGYDHQTDAEAEDMEARERAILANLGVPDPYADRAA
ncbi:MAG: rRNA maturation RNase YbeY [Caulobacteraceae bacterium]